MFIILYGENPFIAQPLNFQTQVVSSSPHCTSHFWYDVHFCHNNNYKVITKMDGKLFAFHEWTRG